MLGPFTVYDAHRAGLSRRQLQSRCWRRIGIGCYVWAGLGASEWEQLDEVMARLDSTAYFSGLTAARLRHLGTVEPRWPEVTVPEGAPYVRRVGADVRRARLDSDERDHVEGRRVTSVRRTLVDLARRAPLVEAVVGADRALFLGLIDLPGFEELVNSWKRRKGVRRLRRVLELCEPLSESPMETRLRLLLVLAGLPRPLAQVEIRDDSGAFLARVDLYYPDARLIIEYDGATHNDSLEEDNRRQNRLVQARYTVLRFTKGDVFERPKLTVALVRQARQRVGRGT